MILLKTEVKKQIKDDARLFVKSCEILDVKQATLNKYLENDSSRLTELDFLNHLIEQTGLSGKQLLTGGLASPLLAK